jgi:transcription initiation factor TFIIIB Brf1 subunit/transcription initiation factor TFIIB
MSLNCECQDSNIYVNNGFKVCDLCGTTLDSELMISEIPEWREFTGNLYMTLLDNSDQLLNKNRLFFESLGVERRIVERSLELFTKLQENYTGRITRSLKAACLYYSYRTLDIFIEKSSIVKLTSITISVLNKGIHMFTSILGDEYIKMKPYEMIKYVTHYCEKLGLEKFIDSINEMSIKALESTHFQDDNKANVIALVILLLQKQSIISVNKNDVYIACKVSKQMQISKFQTMETLLKDSNMIPI